MRIALAFALVLAVPVPVQAIELVLPIACTPGVDCAVQHYVDRDPGGDRRDYMCGHQTYDGHDGVDIRVTDLRAMEAGVAVIAAAGGIVTATRDGMADESVAETGVDAVKDRECGNGVMVAHADGWSTQYCHMKNGSIRVEKGDTVEAGTPLGEVGLSGLTEFPHVHFTVRHGDAEVDPFAIEPLGDGAACPFAGEAGTSIWTPAAKEALAYRPAFILNAGFADGPTEPDQIESGTLADVRMTPESPALVFYGRAIGLEQGDVQRLVVRAPDGSVFAESELEPLDRPKAQYSAYTGKKRRDAVWPTGAWLGRYAVIRDGKEIAVREVELDLQQ